MSGFFSVIVISRYDLCISRIDVLNVGGAIRGFLS